jgi:xanthine dehydrogenase YagR molybdenum-binding subunit
MAQYIGTATARVDGHAKVTGTAKYAAEFNLPGLAYGCVVSSGVAKGRITEIDTADALKVEGVLDVLTHEHRPRMARTTRAYQDDVAPGGTPFRPLYDAGISHSGQPVALVLAEDWETACYAGSLVRVQYERASFVTDLHGWLDTAAGADAPAKPRGKADEAFAAAAVQHDGEYYVPTEHHNPIELHGATVRWEDGKITVYDKTQGVQNIQRYICKVFRMKPDDVRVISRHVGGAFGSGLRPGYYLTLAVLGALALKRSVRLVLTRAQTFTLGYRPGTIQRVALGANSGGTLEAIRHEATSITSRYEDFVRDDTSWSGALYKCQNSKVAQNLVKLDFATPTDMRAPGGATGVFALECAMDELAVALAVDPVELRLRCYSDRDQNAGVPYSSKKLRECYRQGAEAFGWERRRAKPRSMRQDGELIGWGMATGIWEAMQQKTTVRITLTANGHAEVACATADIGTGTYTIMTQLAADMLGLPLENVSVKLGDSTLPQSPVEGGSWTAASVAGAIGTTVAAIRKDLWRMAKAVPDSPLAREKLDAVALHDGTIAAAAQLARAVSIADAMRYGGVDRIERRTSASSNDDGSHARYAHSAVFAEVKVDEQLGVIRVTRVVNAVAAGRILNSKTARSQVMGGVVWGIGMALHEEALVDHDLGRYVNANLGEYHVPVNADVRDIEVIFVDEPDAIINPLGIKGVGEIGVVGTAAAIANAIYHATGKRIRDLPITLDKLGAA